MNWNSTLRSGKPITRKTPLRQGKPKKPTHSKKMRSRGMKGRAPTTSQMRFHGLLASVVGCIACRQEGGYTDFVSIHHIDGRTKPNAHWLVLPLCGPHHQDMGISGVIPVHPYKTRFEAAYGTQLDLLRRSIQILIGGGFVVPEAALTVAGMQKECPTSVAADSGVAHNALEI